MGQSERFWTDQYFTFHAGYYESRHNFRTIPWTWHLLSLFSRLPSSFIIVCFMCRPLASQLEGFCTSHGFYIYYFDRKDRAIKICFLWFFLPGSKRQGAVVDVQNESTARCGRLPKHEMSKMAGCCTGCCRSVALHQVNVLHLHMLLQSSRLIPAR